MTVSIVTMGMAKGLDTWISQTLTKTTPIFWQVVIRFAKISFIAIATTGVITYGDYLKGNPPTCKDFLETFGISVIAACILDISMTGINSHVEFTKFMKQQELLNARTSRGWAHGWAELKPAVRDARLAMLSKHIKRLTGIEQSKEALETIISWGLDIVDKFREALVNND